MKGQGRTIRRTVAGNQRWTGLLRGFAMLAIIALTVKMLVPEGYMPGTSITQPIVLCPDQGPMPTMAPTRMMGQHHHHAPSNAPHDKADHGCAFAGLGAAVLAPTLDGTPLAAVLRQGPPPGGSRRDLVPGRGMAAPPPPSRAPPLLRA